MDLDANATTRLLPEVLDAMLPWLRDGAANPSGVYRAAKKSRAAIDHAREQVAAMVGGRPEEVVFTGCGTESVNSALLSLNELAGDGVAVSSAIEHSAVLRCLDALPREKRKLPVDSVGVVELPEGWLNDAAFVSVMAANNETGVIQPIGEIARQAAANGVAVHTDAIQAAGKLAIDVREWSVDLLSLSAHKFHGPKGVGALWIRSGCDFRPLLRGGGQERGRRSGTENVAGIVGMGMAAELAQKRVTGGEMESLRAIRDTFEALVLRGLEGVTPNGDPQRRLPNTSHLSFENCDAAALLILMDNAGVACSAGSACMTGKQQPSHVQLAMGIPEAVAKTSARFSFSCLNSLEEAQAAAAAVVRAVEKIRRVQGNHVGPVVVYSSD